MTFLRHLPAFVIGAFLAALALTACDDSNGSGNDDGLLTGLSGLVIVVIAGVLIYRYFARRSSR